MSDEVSAFVAREQRHKYGKRLRKLLSRADDEAFARLVWASDAHFCGRSAAARGVCQIPKGYEAEALSPAATIRPWELETLMLELLLTPKCKFKDGLRRITNCRNFATIAEAANLLRNLENAEAGTYLDRIGIFTELNRIAHRQFPWQLGYFNKIQLFRYSYIYGLGKCGEYFRDTSGLTFNEFSFIGFAMLSGLLSNDFVLEDRAFVGLPVKVHNSAAALQKLSLPIKKLREKALEYKQRFAGDRTTPTAIAYRPSVLRSFPVIQFGNRLRAPIPELILNRITAGVYYDIVGGPSSLRNEAADRYEEYCRRLISTLFPRFLVNKGQKYRVGQRVIEAPDCLVSDFDRLVVAVECKATKLVVSGQFGDDPISEAERGYKEIATGIFQLWRFFAHIRLGFVNHVLDTQIVGLVLTLDTWLTLDNTSQVRLFKMAEELADKDGDIAAEDRRKVLVCAIPDFELTALRANEDAFLATLRVSTEGKFTGWDLRAIQRDMGLADVEKDYPFELDEALPWWSAIDNEIQCRKANGLEVGA